MKFFVRCVGYKKNERYFTVGKLYLWDSGVLISDDGFKYTGAVKGEDLDMWELSEWYIFEKEDFNIFISDKEIEEFLF